MFAFLVLEASQSEDERKIRIACGGYVPPHLVSGLILIFLRLL
jgi:hypothetical protein